MTAADLIEHHQLQTHPEGGWYRENHRADQNVISPVTGEQRSAFTHIYFLLERGQLSRFHKVFHGETWNFFKNNRRSRQQNECPCPAQINSGPRTIRNTLQNRKKCSTTKPIITPSHHSNFQPRTEPIAPATRITASRRENRNPGANSGAIPDTN